MAELIEIAGISLVCSAFFSFFFSLVWSYVLTWRLDQAIRVERNRAAAAKSNKKQDDLAEHMQAAMVQALSMLKSGKPYHEVLLEVSSKYPDVAMSIGKEIDKAMSEQEGSI